MPLVLKQRRFRAAEDGVRGIDYVAEGSRRMKNIHDGHRDRMREKVKKFGCGCLAEHELLEMLLFYVNARGNTNDTAHELISKFGGLQGVFEASTQELMSISGVGDKSALLFHLISECYKYMHGTKNKGVSLSNSAVTADYVKSFFRGVKTEQLYIFCLDVKYRVCTYELVAEGWVDSAMVNKREMVKVALNSGAYRVIIAHNHPSGDASPSMDDINITRQLMETFKSVGVPLVDHIIVAENGYYSFMMGGAVDFEGASDMLKVAQYSKQR